MNATSPAAAPEPATINNSGAATASGGLKAIWHLEIRTEKEAQALLEMQNQAIINLLTWAAAQENDTSHKPDSSRETRRNDSRETLELAA